MEEVSRGRFFGWPSFPRLSAMRTRMSLFNQHPDRQKAEIEERIQGEATRGERALHRRRASKSSVRPFVPPLYCLSLPLPVLARVAMAPVRVPVICIKRRRPKVGVLLLNDTGTEDNLGRRVVRLTQWNMRLLLMCSSQILDPPPYQLKTP